MKQCEETVWNNLKHTDHQTGKGLLGFALKCHAPICDQGAGSPFEETVGNLRWFALYIGTQIFVNSWPAATVTTRIGWPWFPLENLQPPGRTHGTPCCRGAVALGSSLSESTPGSSWKFEIMNISTFQCPWMFGWMIFGSLWDVEVTGNWGRRFRHQLSTGSDFVRLSPELLKLCQYLHCGSLPIHHFGARQVYLPADHKCSTWKRMFRLRSRYT